ncbi:TetR/AcrR family transcriptional regulator [Yunchengibacter salinarum]|uniref:TetR/AcrR family transcriptional regulator n=1 Tax=Yunchengibacter salinarum TaxID=3133399 RepID=UPI0035B6805F
MSQNARETESRTAPAEGVGRRAQARSGRHRLAELLTPVFCEHGYEGASLARLSAAAGLKKASLYHHYPDGKRDMARHVLAHAGARLNTLVLLPLDDGGPAQDRIIRSIEGARTYYGGDVPVCLMNTLMMGEGRALFAPAIRATVAAWIRALTGALVDVGRPAERAPEEARRVLERVQGALVLCRVEGSRRPLDDTLDDLKRLISR